MNFTENFKNGKLASRTEKSKFRSDKIELKCSARIHERDESTCSTAGINPQK
jgi:hypothetical protein